MGALAEMRRANSDHGGNPPVFIVDDAHLMLQTTLSSLVELARSHDAAGPAVKLVLVAEPDFEEIFRRLIPSTAGPAFELKALPTDEAKSFAKEVLRNLGADEDFLSDEETEILIERWHGNPSYITRALKWRMGAVKEGSAKDAADLKEDSKPGRVKAATFQTSRTNAGQDLYRDKIQVQKDNRDDTSGSSKSLLARPGVTAIMIGAFLATGVVGFHGASLFSSSDLTSMFTNFQEAPVMAVTKSLPAEPRELYRFAVENGDLEPDLAFVAINIAALKGHMKAAYFLGQMHETGEASSSSPALAVSWYKLASSEVPRAALRQSELSEIRSEMSGSDNLPQPIHAEILASGDLVLIWRDDAGPLTQDYRIDFASKDMVIVESVDTTVPSVLIRPHPKSEIFSVRTARADGSHAPSEWFRLP